MFWQSKPKPQETTFSDPAFRITFSGHWTQETSTDPTRWSYRTDDKHEQLTVSMIGDTQKLDRDERVKAFRRIVEMRKNVETKMPGFENVAVTEPSFAETGGILAARYSGVDAERQRRFHCLLLGSSRTIMIFYYEGIEMTETQSEDRARAIFNSITIPR